MGIVQQEDIFTTWHFAKVNDLKTSTSTVSCVGMWISLEHLSGENPSGGLSGDFLFPVEHFALCGKDLNTSSLLLSKMLKSNISLLFNTAVISSCLQMSEALSDGLHRAQRNVRPACWPQASLYYVWLSGRGVHVMWRLWWLWKFPCLRNRF